MPPAALTLDEITQMVGRIVLDYNIQLKQLQDRIRGLEEELSAAKRARPKKAS